MQRSNDDWYIRESEDFSIVGTKFFGVLQNRNRFEIDLVGAILNEEVYDYGNSAKSQDLSQIFTFPGETSTKELVFSFHFSQDRLARVDQLFREFTPLEAYKLASGTKSYDAAEEFKKQFDALPSKIRGKNLLNLRMALSKQGDIYDSTNQVAYVPADIFTVVGSFLSGVSGPLDMQNRKLSTLTGGRKSRKSRKSPPKRKSKIRKSLIQLRKSQKRKRSIKSNLKSRKP